MSKVHRGFLCIIQFTRMFIYPKKTLFGGLENLHWCEHWFNENQHIFPKDCIFTSAYRLLCYKSTNYRPLMHATVYFTGKISFFMLNGFVYISFCCLTAVQIAVLITNGPSDDQVDAAARAVADNGISLFAVGECGARYCEFLQHPHCSGPSDFIQALAGQG